jgi:hypothetical protein
MGRHVNSLNDAQQMRRETASAGDDRKPPTIRQLTAFFWWQQTDRVVQLRKPAHQALKWISFRAASGSLSKRRAHQSRRVPAASSTSSSHTYLPGFRFNSRIVFSIGQKTLHTQWKTLTMTSSSPASSAK